MKCDEFIQRLVDEFRWVSDEGTRSSGADRTRWAHNPLILAQIGNKLTGLFESETPTVVVGPQSSGYLYGALAAASVGAGFVGAEKERGMLADSDPWLTAVTPLDYQGRNMKLSFRNLLLSPSDRVLLVDDWADTGGQLLALKSLVEQAGATLIGSAVIVDGLSEHSVRRILNLRGLLNLRALRD